MVDREQIAKIRVHDDLGSLLMLRRTVAPWFRRIARLEPNQVVLDFSKVQFMSRSFADEYLAAKKAIAKRIEERHVPLGVRQMLRIVSRRQIGGRAREFWATQTPPQSVPVAR